jgi:hypothetical protein
MKDPVAEPIEQAFEAARRRADPSPEDRARISERLRRELGADVVDVLVRDPGVAHRSPEAAPRMVATREGWLAAVVGTGIITGALGFMLGYGLGSADRPEAAASPVAVPAAPAVTPAASPPTPAAPAVMPAAPAVTLRGPAAAPSAALPHALPAADDARRVSPSIAATPVRRRAAASEREARETAASATSARSGASSDPEPPRERASASVRAPAQRLAFDEVVERLRRANLALGDGKATLAMIELGELDRLAGDTLKEEREMTRILAACAMGDTEGAARHARRLLASAAGSIYAPRIEHSCATDPER